MFQLPRKVGTACPFLASSMSDIEREILVRPATLYNDAELDSLLFAVMPLLSGAFSTYSGSESLSVKNSDFCCWGFGLGVRDPRMILAAVVLEGSGDVFFATVVKLFPDTFPAQLSLRKDFHGEPSYTFGCSSCSVLRLSFYRLYRHRCSCCSRTCRSTQSWTSPGS